MPLLTRRQMLAASAASLGTSSLLSAKRAGFKLGVTDWNLHLGGGQVEAVQLASRLGFEGVQISFGRKVADNRMSTDNPELMAKYMAASKQYRIPLDGTCADILHVNGLKNDKLAVKWVQDSIRLTHSLGVKVLLLPFFGKKALETQAEKEYVGDLLRDLGKEAEKADVILGLENTISAEDNVRIMERSRSKAVLVYYDVGNSTINGFDIVKEIRWLGKSRICQIHLKDNPHYLGEGKIEFQPVLHAIRDIGFTGFANLETDSPSKSIETDMQRNLSYIKKLMEQA